MMAEETFPIEEFKGLLLRLLKNKFKICSEFENLIKKSNSEAEIIAAFKFHRDEVYEKLGGVIDDYDYLNDEIYRLEETIRELISEKNELEGELEDVKLGFGNTLDDEYKLAAFKEYYDEYTPWQLEELLKNGKKFLKIKSFDNWMEELKLIAFKFSPREYPLESKWDLDFWKKTYYDKKLTPQETWDVYTTMIY